MLELADPPKTQTKREPKPSSDRRSDGDNRRPVFGIHAGLEESAGGYIALSNQVG